MKENNEKNNYEKIEETGLDENDISLKINGEDANSTDTLTTGSILKTLSAPTSIENGIQYILTLSNFEQAVRQTGKEFLEWSGNIELTVANKTIFDIYSVPKFVSTSATPHNSMTNVGNANTSKRCPQT